MKENEEYPIELFLRPPKSESTFGDLTSIHSKQHSNNMFNRIPSDVIRDISAFLNVSSLGSMSMVSSAVHSDLDRVMKIRQSEYMNRPPTEVDKYGTKRWYDEKGLLHRINGPALVESNGDKSWLYRGLLNRKDGPAVIVCDDTTGIRIREEWWYENKLHREDGPAVREFRMYEVFEWEDDDDDDDLDSNDWRGNLVEECWIKGVCSGNEITYDVWWSDCFEHEDDEDE